MDYQLAKNCHVSLVAHEIITYTATARGAVLSPLLFLTFINDLTKHFPPDVHATLFAADLAMWSTETTIASAERKVQLALDAFTNWSETWKSSIRSFRQAVQADQVGCGVSCEPGRSVSPG